MKKYGWLVALIVAVAVVAVLAGCGQNTVAEINGKKISKDDFYKYMQTRAGSQMLQQMLDDRLTLALAEERGVAPTDEQVEKQFEMFSKMADLKTMMEERGLTEEQVKDELKVMAARQNMAVKVAGDQIKDKEIKDAYEQQKTQRYDIPERVRVELLSFRNKESADKAAAELKKGTSMEKVAEESEDHGQVIKQLVPKSGPGMPPEIVKAAFDTPKGKTSNPVKLSFGGGMGQGQEQWLIIKAGERVPPTKISLEDAKPMIKGELALMKASQDAEYQKQLSEAKKTAKIKVIEPSLKQVEKNFKQG